MIKFNLLGYRITKTVVAVFLCFLIDMALSGVRNGLPFFSAIAAILCVQRNKKKSLTIALDRFIATLVGGEFGIALMAFEYYIVAIPFEILRYFVISILLVPIINICVTIRRKGAVAVACIVFLCITVAHQSDTNPFVFGINRMIDTTIGIAVALVVNLVPQKLHLFRHSL